MTFRATARPDCPAWCVVTHDADDPGEHESSPVRLGSLQQSDGREAEPYVMIAHAPIGSPAVFVYVGDGFDAHIDLALEAFRTLASAFAHSLEPTLGALPRR